MEIVEKKVYLNFYEKKIFLFVLLPQNWYVCEVLTFDKKAFQDGLSKYFKRIINNQAFPLETSKLKNYFNSSQLLKIVLEGLLVTQNRPKRSLSSKRLVLFVLSMLLKNKACYRMLRSRSCKPHLMLLR